MKKQMIRLLGAGFIALSLASGPLVRAAGMPPAQEYYQLKVYHLQSPEQEEQVDRFLEEAFLPALHRAGISTVGVFKTMEDAPERRIYVLIPYRNLEQIGRIAEKLDKDREYLVAGSPYLDAAHDSAPYQRIETILLKAFEGMPRLALPDLKAPKKDRVYELRSYESPTEKLHRNKVRMFNQGNEIGLFRRLGFNAVFYGSVLAGGQMPNLMYMTTFEGKADRDQHWDAFRADPEWERLSGMKEYQNNVSKSDILFLRPADYSDI